MVPLAKVYPWNRAVAERSAVGLSSSPAADAAWTKSRFGHVGPGMAENQWSQTANSRASAFMTGSWSGRKHRITRPGSTRGPDLWVSSSSREANPELEIGG